MTQIPQEELPRIFAVYWGSEHSRFVLCATFTNTIGPTTHWDYLDGCQILLTPLDKITDEDAIEVAKIVYGEASHYANIFEGKELITASNTLIQIADYVEITDFLRSKSYNIGYGSYSPAQLIETGVVKLKTA